MGGNQGEVSMAFAVPRTSTIPFSPSLTAPWPWHANRWVASKQKCMSHLTFNHQKVRWALRCICLSGRTYGKDGLILGAKVPEITFGLTTSPKPAGGET